MNSQIESQLPRSDDQDECIDLPERQEPNFPDAELARLDEMVNRKHSWVVPVLPKGELEVLLDAAINLSKLGLDTRSEACQRFYRDGLTISFNILTNEAVSGWKFEVLRGIMKNFELLVQLCVQKLNQNCLPLLELLAMVLNPNCRFHTFNGTKASESVPGGSQLTDDGIFSRPSDPSTPKGWLVDLINKFGNLGGFSRLLDRLQNDNALPVPVLAALIKPFGLCQDFLTIRTIEKYFIPIVEIVPVFLDNLTDDELSKEAESETKVDALCGIVETLKCLASKVPNQELTVKNLEIFYLNMILRLLQIPSFNGKMKAFNEFDKLMRSVLIFKQNPEDEDKLTAIKRDECIKRNKVLHFILKDNDHQPQVKTEIAVAKNDRPWLDLQQTYVAIAAANYESLTEIISSSKNDGMELFQNSGKSLKWEDFSVELDTTLFVLPDKHIYGATYKPQEKDVMLMVMPRKQNTARSARNLSRYPVLASFTDNLPGSQFSVPSSPFKKLASVYVLQRCKVTTVERFAENAALQKDNRYMKLRNFSFVLLQLVDSLKRIQAEGIEEIGFDFSRLILMQDHEDKPPIFILFPEDVAHMTLCENRKTLCQIVLSALYFFLRINHVNDLDECEMNGERLAESVANIFKAIAKILLEEKASSLSQAKWFLEYMLWGPVKVKVLDCQTDLNNVLQRWLDLQRAQMVQSIISQLHNSHLPVYEEYQLVFLLHASVKSLKSILSKL